MSDTNTMILVLLVGVVLFVVLRAQKTPPPPPPLTAPPPEKHTPPPEKPKPEKPHHDPNDDLSGICRPNKGANKALKQAKESSDDVEWGDVGAGSFDIVKKPDLAQGAAAVAGVATGGFMLPFQIGFNAGNEAKQRKTERVKGAQDIVTDCHEAKTKADCNENVCIWAVV